MKYTPEEVMQFVQEEDVKFIRLAFCDVYGKQHNVAIMPSELKRAFAFGIAIDASAIDGFGGEIRSEQELSEESLFELAAELGLDTEQFTDDLNSPEVAETVAANAQQGIDLGAFSTPSFILGGSPMVGAQPTEVFTTAVDEALDRAQG